mgnify:CR=1 FL=1
MAKGGPQTLPPVEDGDQQHKIHVYYGFGKGKTTCCIGLAIRALGAGKRVGLVQFDKGYDGKEEHYSERHLLRSLDGIEIYPTGCERMLDDGSFRFGAEPKDISEAERGVDIGMRLIREGIQNLLILDEILAAAAYGLLDRTQVMNLIDEYDKDRRCELILSGHEVWDDLLNRADLVTEMKKVKHYYTKGTGARLGIEY